MSGDTGDAVYARPGPSWRERTYLPRHPDVWVRVRGAWVAGVILRWVTIDPEHSVLVLLSHAFSDR
jgi:hypothetical protein